MIAPLHPTPDAMAASAYPMSYTRIEPDAERARIFAAGVAAERARVVKLLRADAAKLRARDHAVDYTVAVAFETLAHGLETP